MARPSTTLSPINSQAGDWDQTVDANTDSIETLVFEEPYPAPIVHRSVADSGSSPLPGFSASNYKWCMAIVVDPATPSTNGHMIYSDGSNWIYSRSGNTV